MNVWDDFFHADESISNNGKSRALRRTTYGEIEYAYQGAITGKDPT